MRFHFLLILAFSSSAQEMPIDWQKARELHQRAQRGETLSTEEQQYYDMAKRQRGQPAAPRIPPVPPPELTPLTDLRGEYQGQDGGLYGGGANTPSAGLAARAREAAAKIQPLDPSGQPAAEGRIALMSIGMSNTTQAFSAFMRLASTDPRKAANVVLVDGAQGGMTAQRWAQEDRPWATAAQRLAASGVTAAQVQALWVKQANAGPRQGWPTETDRLREDLRTLLERARRAYPNVRLIFLSSRTYAGYATTGLNPEPYAYESAFAVRKLIQDQPTDGPVLLWGPYLWTAGEKGRAMDDFQWLRTDTAPDGTHPSRAGQEKVGRLLLEFFATDPYAAPWFARR